MVTARLSDGHREIVISRIIYKSWNIDEIGVSRNVYPHGMVPASSGTNGDEQYTVVDSRFTVLSY